MLNLVVVAGLAEIYIPREPTTSLVAAADKPPD